MQRVGDIIGKAFRETAFALDRLALTMRENEIFRDTLSRHRSIMPINGNAPSLKCKNFVAPNASLIGDVSLGSGSSVCRSALMVLVML